MVQLFLGKTPSTHLGQITLGSIIETLTGSQCPDLLVKYTI
ncbi:hypothetical protein TSAR_015132 [Trichomalopsis sarcophagae]|uniref:Uncharacterized protein n=1 Tax=Trichomalopsis sarcophagae TaxID=543379 RepID=A0A232EH42_9HYME|nr:hypothetical protein TSAR_015132 [Trichomalopsis sarcophagae]